MVPVGGHRRTSSWSGWGIPGAEYEGTRHNIGADAVALPGGAPPRLALGRKGPPGPCRPDPHRRPAVLCAVPLTYMNESGLAVAPLVRRAGIDEPVDGSAATSRLVVVHDELDLPSGRVKVKAGGGTAGNNGLKSIHAHLHTGDYLRVRIGIGKPPGRQPGADYVLKRPGKDEREALAVAAEVAADAVELIATLGAERR